MRTSHVNSTAHTVPARAAARSRRPFTNYVVVAVDGSPAAESAVPIASRIAARISLPLRVLYVAVPQTDATTGPTPLFFPESLGISRDQIEVREGDPATEILRVANDSRTYMMILTTHGRSIEPGRHLGHVSETVVAWARHTTMLIRPEAAENALASLETPRFMLPLDGSAATERAIGHITDLVCRVNGSFDVLYVADPLRGHSTAEPGDFGIPCYVDQPQHEWPSWVNEVIEHLSACTRQHPLGIETRVHVSHGPIESVVLNFASEHRADIVVLVRRSHLEPGRARVLLSILDKTPCPVLLVGAPRPHR